MRIPGWALTDVGAGFRQYQQDTVDLLGEQMVAALLIRADDCDVQVVADYDALYCAYRFLAYCDVREANLLDLAMPPFAEVR